MKSLTATFLIFALYASTAFGFDTSTGSKDPTKVVGADSCVECHQSAAAVWQATHHHNTYVDLPENEKAGEIAGALGIDVYQITTHETCRQCHFTVQEQDSELKSIAGISCESCHGASADWIDVHNDDKIDYEARMDDAASKGMNRPGNYYNLFKNCYECHSAPNEELVNKGGHPAGSKFELVSWSQGEIRHTFSDDETENILASPEKKRILFVLGKALDMEAALQGLTVAENKKGPYFKAMIKRFSSSLKSLKAIKKQLGGNEHVDAMIQALGTKLNPKNKESLVTASENLQKATKAFLEIADELDLSALDKFIPKKTKGKPAAYHP